MNAWQRAALVVLLLAAAQAQAEDTVHYYYTDPQGTVLAKADVAGNVVASYDYAPYGSQAMGAPPSGGPTGYTGHVNDADTGLVYMQARYYDPEVGRFLSVDPVGVGAGDAFNFNRFAYANNNPIVNDDPTGQAICSASGGGGCEKIKEQKMARDRAEQGSIEAQAPGSSAFLSLGGGYAASDPQERHVGQGVVHPNKNDVNGGRFTGNHSMTPVHSVDKNKWGLAAILMEGDTQRFASKAGVIVQPSSIAGPVKSNAFWFTVSQLPIGTNGAPEPTSAPPRWFEPVYHSSGLVGNGPGSGFLFTAPSGVGGNKWTISYPFQEDWHQNAKSALYIYTPLH